MAFMASSSHFKAFSIAFKPAQFYMCPNVFDLLLAANARPVHYLKF